jgi:CDP-diacylglycerol--serine O-phosphatidyltransferase
MLKAVNNDQPRRRRRRKRRLKKIQMLPTLLTLGSACFGFAALYCCALELQDLGAGEDARSAQTLGRAFLETKASTYLAIAAWMVLAGMICDALDGRIARLTRTMSRFGEQLDSLVDAITFGVAPALMIVTFIRRELASLDTMPFGYDRFPQMVWLMATVYVCCAVLRLARFNVEASSEEAAHIGFRGLPSPGGAGAIISMIYIHDQYKYQDQAPWIADYIVPWLTHGIVVATPLLTLMIALLMVSRIPYRHFVSAFLRRRPFRHVIPVMLAIPCVYLFTEEMGALVGWGFVLTGLIQSVIAKFRGKSLEPKPDEDSEPPGVSESSPEIKHA